METATMEELPAAQRALELASFANLGTGQLDMVNNTTPGGKYSARLNPADTYINDFGQTSPRVIGPAKSLRVKAGDVVEMEVYAKYIGSSSNTNFVTGLAGLVTGSLSLTSSGESLNAFNAIDHLFQAGSLVPNSGGSIPKAYLQYLLFDDNFAPLVGSDCNCYTRVTSDANNAFEKLVLSVEIQEDGYLYTYVANESTENINVWFDDFTVTHLGLDVLQSTSYYPFGGLAENVQKEKYRFDYQGQFAEKDEETGFNHFELRDYDPVIGRWLTIDPVRQYASPYIGMGNDWINRIDPDGGVDGCRRCERVKNPSDFQTVSDGKNGTFSYIEAQGKWVKHVQVEARQHDASIGPRPMTVADNWMRQINDLKFGKEVALIFYNTADAIYGASFFFRPWEEPRHMNGFGFEGSERVDGLVTTLSTLNPMARFGNATVTKGIGIGTFNSTVKGTAISTLSPATKGTILKQVNKFVIKKEFTNATGLSSFGVKTTNSLIFGDGE